MQSQPSKLQQVFKGFVALLISAVVIAIVVAILFAVSAKQPEGFAIAFLFAFIFTAAHSFLLGGPLLLLGAWRNAIRWWSCLLIGFLVGFIPSALVTGSDFLSAWPMGLFGLIGGLTFWLVWHYWVQRGPALPFAEPAEPGAMIDHG